jgi:hypothetical protein
VQRSDEYGYLCMMMLFEDLLKKSKVVKNILVIAAVID